MFGWRFEGGEELAAAIRALPARTGRKVTQDAFLEGAEPVRRDIVRITRRAPGLPDLASNINLATLRKRAGDDPESVSVGIGTPRRFFYDYFLEFGTVRHGAFPMYRPPFDAGVPKVLGIVGAALWRELASKGVQRPTVVQPTSIQGMGRLV